jgi:putative tricarboxylic transport membrane protein
VRPVAVGEFAVALGLILVAGAIALEATTIPVAAVYAKIGPRAFPYGAALGLGLVGLALAVTAWRGAASGGIAAEEAEPAPSPPARRALGWLGVGLAANAALIAPLGFVLASTALFAAVARAFGSVRPLRDAAAGFALALALHQGFLRLLGLDLGSGVFAGF